MIRRTLTLFAAGVLFALLGCKDPGNTSFEGTFTIKLVDAPAALEALNVVFRRIEIHRAGAAATVGWRVVSEDLATYDILTLRNGVSRQLVSAVVPEGDYDRIMILFGVSSMRLDGIESTLELPAGLQSGLQIEHQFRVEEGKFLGLTFDFDATRSIRSIGGGRYELRPIIRVQNTDFAGSIIGAVAPDTIQSFVSTVVGADSVTTLTLAQQGNNSFEIVDIPEATYAVRVTPASPAYLDTVISGITVVRRQKTNIGAVVLRLR